MNTPQPAIVSDSGWEAQVRSAFKDGVSEVNPVYPLTQKQTPGSTIYVVPVWQYQLRGQINWITPPSYSKETFEEWSDIMYRLHDAATRLAFQPVPNPKLDEAGEKKDCDGYIQPITNDEVEQPNISRAAEKEAHDFIFPVKGVEYSINYLQQLKAEKQLLKDFFLKGANHILQSGEYISVAEVEKLFNCRIAALQEMQLSKLEREHVINEDEYMLIKIQNLKHTK